MRSALLTLAVLSLTVGIGCEQPAPPAVVVVAESPRPASPSVVAEPAPPVINPPAPSPVEADKPAHVVVAEISKPSANPQCECAPGCKCVGGCKCGQSPKRDAPKAAPPVRQKRCLYFTATWCPHCRANEPTFAALRGTGWRVGPEDTAHVQTVDIDARPDLAARYGVGSIPAWVVLDGDRVTARRNGHLDQWAVGRLFGATSAPKLAARPATASADLHRHSHVCPRCRFEWWHDEREAATNPRAHNCPKCGAYQNVVHQWAPGAKP